MKRSRSLSSLLLLCAVLAISGLAADTAQAQETYTLNATAGQVTDLTSIVTSANARTCIRVGAAGGESCTQAQACSAIGNPTNCSSTASVARGLNVRIFPLTQAGREEYVTFTWVAPLFIAAIDDPTAFEHERACINWQGFNTTQRNAVCTAFGRPTGCRLCR